MIDKKLKKKSSIDSAFFSGTVIFFLKACNDNWLFFFVNDKEMERDFPQPVFYLSKWGKETQYMHVVIKN